MTFTHYIVTIVEDGNIKELTYNDLEEARIAAVYFRVQRGLRNIKLHKREMTFTELDAFEGWEFENE